MKTFLYLLLLILSSTHSFSQENEVAPKDGIIEKASTSAVFPGGDKALFKFITESIVYPEEALKKKESGIVGVEFIVDTTGKVKDVKINHSQSKSLDQESIRVIESMPKWRPATENGKKVNARLVLPIKFDLPFEE